MSVQNNLLVPVLAKPQTTQSKASDTGSGEARESIKPQRHDALGVDSRGEQKILAKVT
jgi:hypothetical protein